MLTVMGQINYSLFPLRSTKALLFSQQFKNCIMHSALCFPCPFIGNQGSVCTVLHVQASGLIFFMNLLILAIYTETEYWSVVGGQRHSSSNLGLLLNLSAACDLHRFSLSDFFPHKITKTC